MGEYETIARLCEASNQLLEIVKKQAEVIAQSDIADEVKNELDSMRKNVDQEMDILEYNLRSYR